MKVMQMQYSPDAFDGFIKGKLDEIKPDPALAEEYWDKINTQIKNPGSNRRWLIYVSVALFLLSVFLYMLLQERNDDAGKAKPSQADSTTINDAQIITAVPKANPSAGAPNNRAERLGNTPPKSHPDINLTGQPKTRMNKTTQSIPSQTGNDALIPEAKLPELKTERKQTDSMASSPLPISAAQDSIQARQPDVPKKDQKRNRVHIIW